VGYAVLQDGGAALDAVEAAVCALEDDETFDAGRGAFLNRDGFVELDAGIMDGVTLRSAAIAAARSVRNPITIARRLLEMGTERLLVGEGVTRFAAEQGIELAARGYLETERARLLWQTGKDRRPEAIFARPSDTVGAVALDRDGRIAVGTSTGGLPGKRPGRVGDSPIVGAGFYASGVAGASASGHGEAILTVGLARLAVQLCDQGASPSSAARQSVEALRDPRIAGAGGVIVLDHAGRVGFAHNTSRMALAWVDGAGGQGATMRA
jgi:beta-aspartyl-peptidase (threonine type)